MPGSRLCRDEREEISCGLARDDSYCEIARILERSVSTISREVALNGGRGAYRAGLAQHRADHVAKRPKPHKLEEDSVLAAKVRQWLAKRWSPAPIAKLLSRQGCDVSAETIYRECYRPGGALGDDAWELLCRRRPTRKRRRRTRTGIYNNPLGAFKLVDVRPPITGEAGHWEGDLIVGAANRSAAAVMTERVTRLTIVAALTSRTADHVADVITRLLGLIPHHLRLTLTWDQGREIAAWKDIETALDTDIYMCRPRSPWEKPLVEHTNGLLRRWLPRKSNLYRPQHEMDTIAQLLNTMPRRILNWDSAQDRYDHLRVATTS